MPHDTPLPTPAAPGAARHASFAPPWPCDAGRRPEPSNEAEAGAPEPAAPTLDATAGIVEYASWMRLLG